MTLKRYIHYSLIFHVVLFIVLGIIASLGTTLKNNFIVLGAHSSKESKTIYKNNQFVPFINKAGKHARAARNNHTKGKKKKVADKSKHQSTGLKKQAPNKSKPTQAKKPIKAKPMTKQHKKQRHEMRSQNEPQLHEPEEPVVNLANKRKQQVKKKKQKQKKSKPLPTTTHPEPEEDHNEEPEVPEKKDPEPEPLVQDIEHVQEADQITDDSSDTTLNTELFDDEISDDINMIGDYSNEEIVVYQRHIQTAIERLWHPPVGVPKGTASTVLFTLRADGSIEKYDFIKRSTILIYDLSITKIIAQLEFHKSLWGKQFKVDFQQ
jgi:hypothetical protein